MSVGIAVETGGPRFRRPSYAVPVVVVGLLVLVLAGLLGHATSGVLVGIVVVLGLVALSICLGSTWPGLFVAISAALLLPTPFSVTIGTASLGVGQVLLLAFIFGWFAAWSRHDSRLAFGRTSLDLPMVMVLVAQALSTIVNTGQLSTRELVGAAQQLVVYALDYFLLSRIVVSVLTSRRRTELLLRYLAGIIAFIAALGVVEFFSHENVFLLVPGLPQSLRNYVTQLAQAATLIRGIPRIHSTFEQPLVLGTALAMGFPLALAFAFRSKGGERLLWWLSTAVIAAAMLMTVSRSVYLLGALTVVAFALVLPRRRWRIGVVVAGVVLAGGLLAANPSLRAVASGIFSLKPNTQLSNTVTHRTEEIAPVWGDVLKKPVLGYGPRTFSATELAFDGLVPPRNNAGTTNQTPVLDDTYLGMLGEGGVIGLGAMCILLLSVEVMAGKLVLTSRKPEDRVLTSGCWRLSPPGSSWVSPQTLTVLPDHRRCSSFWPVWWPGSGCAVSRKRVWSASPGDRQ